MEEANAQTQPLKRHPVFNNWDVVPEAWYITIASDQLDVGQVKPFQIMNQQIVLFRGVSGKVNALDAFCPHMGTDLSIGKVLGENLQCFFHNWEFSGKGECSKIPCQQHIPSSAKTNSYAVCEKYGFIFVYPAKSAPIELLEIEELKGKKILAVADKQNISTSHHHISMINGIDPQHLKTVHKLDIEMNLETQEDEHLVSYSLSGDTPNSTLIEKLTRLLLGPRYCYAMTYAQASIASLTLFRGVHFLKPGWKWPELYMFFAYRPDRYGRAVTQPIFVTEKRPGLWGAIVSHLLIFMTKMAYTMLKDEDEKIYNNIRFSTQLLLPIDQPISHYVRFVNRLKPSIWSNHPPVKKKTNKRQPEVEI